MSDFKFTGGQVANLAAPLRLSRFSEADIKEFIAVAAIEIGEWRQRLPVVDAKALADGRRHMKRIEQHAAGLRYELAALHWLWREPLLCDVDVLFKPLPECTVRPADLDLLLDALLGAAGNQVDLGAKHNSRDTGRKVMLLKALAETFNGCFGKMPTTTPGGAFMEAVAAIGDAIGEPLGRDAVASGIKAFRKEREFFYGPDES